MRIFIVSIDALRADSLGCYGYKRATSPRIDAIASEGVVFKNAYTQSNWTNPSFYSLITSLYPSVHGITHHRHGIAGNVNTLPEVLARKGYHTALYSNYYNLLDEKRFGRYFQERVYFDIDRDSDKLKKKILSPEERDIFFLIHIGNYVHEPYCAPDELVREFWPHQFPEGREDLRPLTEEMNLTDESMRNVFRKVNLHLTRLNREEIDYLKARYDAGIKYIDRWVGDFFNSIKDSSGKEYLFILTSDHGQAFFEHGFFGHGLSLHQELIRVPLIFSSGGISAGEIDSYVRLTDIFPTLTDILGIGLPADIDGVSFRAILEGKESEERWIICEGFPSVACIYGRKKLIISFYHLMDWKEKLKRIGDLIRTGKFRRLLLHLYSIFRTGFYDLETDPREEKNRSGKNPPEMKKMKRYLKEWYQRCRSRSLEITEEEIEDKRTIEQLKNLGYL